MNNWIPIEEGLPENVNEVLMGGECCEVCYNIDIGFYEHGEWWMKNGEHLKWPITHWQPLPDAPHLKNYHNED